MSARPAPPPLLAGPPIPLPDQFAGAWAGATVSYDLDRLVEWDFARPRVLRSLLGEQTGLTADQAALASDDEPAILAFNARQRDLNHRFMAAKAAYLVANLCGPVPLHQGDPVAGWEDLSFVILRWVTQEGIAVAFSQLMAPFSSPAAPPSLGIGA